MDERLTTEEWRGTILDITGGTERKVTTEMDSNLTLPGGCSVARMEAEDRGGALALLFTDNLKFLEPPVDDGPFTSSVK